MTAQAKESTRLEFAIKKAIAESLGAANWLWKNMAEALTDVDKQAEPLRKLVARSGGRDNGAGPERGQRVAQQYLSELILLRKHVADLFKRQREVLSTFNVVLFGRTGVGKSSLLEAMTEGDGESVSQGESDWTTDVRPVQWKECRLFDTPGINGWGRTRPRSELEASARKAVEIADLVILCFDSQNQQASEFLKVASWVHTFGKPVVAVLNPRNPVWRKPERVPVASQRRTLSRSVREHAGNISDELARIGLFGVPVLAIGSKTALFSRAAEKFRGPDKATFKKYRKEFGQEKLLAWSNLRALEELLTEALEHAAAELRLGMLQSQVRAELSSALNHMEELGREAEDVAETLERFVEATLRIFGYPDQSSETRNLFRSPVARRDLLTVLEDKRGGPFQSPRRGELIEYLEDLLLTEMSLLQTRSMDEAEKLVLNCFDQRIHVDETQFQEDVFDLKAVEDAGKAVVNKVSVFLQQKTAIVAKDAQIDIACLIEETNYIDGKAGRGWRIAGHAGKGGGLLAGVASTLGVVAATNFYNPMGWAAATGALVAGIGAVISGLLGWLGSKAYKKAEQERLRRRGEALAQARSAVEGTYRNYRQKLGQQIAASALKDLAEIMERPLTEAIVARIMLGHIKYSKRKLKEKVEAVPEAKSPQPSLMDAARRVERLRFPDRADAGKLLWLGEDWISDPSNLQAKEELRQTRKTDAYDPSFFQLIAEHMRKVIRRLTETPKPGQGLEWFEDTKRRLGEDVAAVELLAELTSLRDQGKARIQMCGDYSVGKSSFVKRLLIDSGLRVPVELEVRGDPTTTVVSEYPLKDIILVDTPGFHSGRDSHDSRALDSYAEASAIFYLFQPNLISDDNHHIVRILNGDAKYGSPPKLNRTFFIINRSDELGVDPHEDRREFESLAERKKKELSLALKSKGILIDWEDIFCMASDPYGLIGNRNDVSPASFDPFREWDGFRPFAAAFRLLGDDLVRVGMDVSLLEGGLARLGRLRNSMESEMVELNGQLECLERMLGILETKMDEAGRIRKAGETRLRRIVENQAFGMLSETLGAANERELSALQERLKTWWEEDSFLHAIESWWEDEKTVIDNWIQRTQDEIERRLRSPQFRRSGLHVPQSLDQFDGEHKRAKMAGRVVGRLADGLKMASRNVVYQIGKWMGVKFRPWGAVKAAARLQKLGAVLAVAGVALDAFLWYRELKNQDKREDYRRKAHSFVRESAELVCSDILHSSEEDGFSDYIDGIRKDMKLLTEELNQQMSLLRERANSVESRIELYNCCMDRAWALLDIKPENGRSR